MRVGLYSRTDSGIHRDLLYTLADGKLVAKGSHEMRKNFEQLGVKISEGRIYPKDGEKFLKALVERYDGSYLWAKAED